MGLTQVLAQQVNAPVKDQYINKSWYQQAKNVKKPQQSRPINSMVHKGLIFLKDSLQNQL